MKASRKGTLYRSRWDRSTWILLLFTAVCAFSPLIFDDDGLAPVIVGTAVLAGVVIILLSIYYRINEGQLIIYQFFIPTHHSICDITEIRRTHSYFSAPAVSLTHRISISLKNQRLPLIISPTNLDQFIHQLLSINPNITVDLQ